MQAKKRKNMNRARILIVDDHTVFRQGLRSLLEREPDFEVLNDCASVSEALAILRTENPDVILLDIDLGTHRGSDILNTRPQNRTKIPVIVLTAGLSGREEALLYERGAARILRKDISTSMLCTSIREVIHSQGLRRVFTDSTAAAAATPAMRRILFTTREVQVLQHVIEGRGNKEIAAELACSESAVKGIVQQLFRKTGTSTRSQLVRVALEREFGVSIN
jgi:two-component system nitrate/nitrite response regulator NarL